jgi:hypothetical protein
MIDPRDVGAAAAAMLFSAGHEGQTYLFADVPGDAARQAMIGPDPSGVREGDPGRRYGGHA